MPSKMPRINLLLAENERLPFGEAAYENEGYTNPGQGHGSMADLLNTHLN